MKLDKTLVVQLKEFKTSIEDIVDSGSVQDKIAEYEIQNISKELLNKIGNGDDLNEEENELLELIIFILQYVYNNTSVDMVIPDDEFDILNSKSKRVIISAPVMGKDFLNHEFQDLRGTLDKVHFIAKSDKPANENRKSLEEWLNSVENRLGRDLTEGECEFIMTPKWDGLSTIFECRDGKVQTALTRGDVDRNEAKDLTKLFGGISILEIVDTREHIGIKTEIVMKEEDFKKLGIYKNQRSAVSSILNSDEVDKTKLKYLTIMPLQYQTEDKDIPEVVDYARLSLPFKVFKFKRHDFIGILNQMSLFEKEIGRTHGTILRDGIVFRFTNKELQEKLGRDGAINKYEVAYKTPAQEVKTILKDVEFSIGSLGAITPVAKFKEVVVKGNTVKNASLGSIDRLEELNLNKGDEVIIKYDVIPYLYVDETCKKSDGEPIITPKVCPCCGEELVKAPILKCINKECRAIAIGKLCHFVEKMNIKNISDKTVALLYDNKALKDIEDIYTLWKITDKLYDLDGLGKKSVDNIIQAIEDTRACEDYKVLGAIGIADIGNSILKKILNIYYLDELLSVCQEKNYKIFETIDGIKEKTSKKIVDGVNENYDTIIALMQELVIIRTKGSKKSKDSAGKETVCFSKVRNKEFEEFLREQGFDVLDRYTKKVDTVIVENLKSIENPSKKIEKAIADGKLILPIEEAYTKYGFITEMEEDEDDIDDVVSEVLDEEEVQEDFEDGGDE